ncbi:unnamed protein product, partial [Prorocentrum cordatum]
ESAPATPAGGPAAASGDPARSLRARWVVDNSRLQDATEGLGYRQSPRGDAQPQALKEWVRWGCVVEGRVTKDGEWLKVEARGYLPMALGGVPVLRRQGRPLPAQPQDQRPAPPEKGPPAKRKRGRPRKDRPEAAAGGG